MARLSEGRPTRRALFVSLAILALAVPALATPPGPPSQPGPPITPPGLLDNPGRSHPPTLVIGSSTTFSEIGVPTTGSGPLDITLGPDGNVWFTEFFTGNIGRVTSAGVVTEFTGTLHATGIAAGPDGNIWFTDPDHTAILRMKTNGQILNVYPAGAAAEGITPGPDGAMWFTDPGGRIGRITTTGIVTLFTVSGDPQSIRAGSDGNLWFTENSAGQIGRITPLGAVTLFPLPLGSKPAGLCALGTDLWFAEFGIDSIGRISTGAPNTITQYALPAGTGPRDCAPEPGGASVYFTMAASGGIGRITLAGGQTFLSLSSNFQWRITAGADSAMWFTEPFSDAVGRLPVALNLPN